VYFLIYPPHYIQYASSTKLEDFSLESNISINIMTGDTSMVFIFFYQVCTNEGMVVIKVLKEQAQPSQY
jgi:hypothetical protein